MAKSRDGHRRHKGPAAANARPLVSVCLIAKNEERFLEQCLRSVEDLADEIVLVDTGSVDRTMEIARAVGAKVFRHPWRDDFSAARNHAIDHARGHWVVMLDADEQFPPGEAARLRTLLLALPSDVMGISLKINNVAGLSDHRVVDAGRSVRAFRNAPNHRYVSPIHEQIAPSLIKDGRLLASDVHFWHFGYLPDVVVAKDKITRNLSMLTTYLEQLQADDPFRSYIEMQIGREYQRLSRKEDADRYLSRAVRWMESSEPNLPTSPHFYTLAVYYTENLLGLERYSEAKQFAEGSLARLPWSSDLWFCLGVAELHLDQLAMGITHLLWATAVAETHKDRQEFYSPSRSITAWRNAALALIKLGAQDAALQLLLTALQDAPEDPSLHEVLLPLLRERPSLMPVMAQKVSGDLLTHIFKACLIYGDEASITALADAVDLAGRCDPALTAFWRAARHLMLGDFAEAIPLLEKVPLVGDIGGWAQLGRILAFSRTGREDDVARFLLDAPSDNFHTLQREIAGLPTGEPPEGYSSFRSSFVPLLARWHVEEYGDAAS